MSFRDNYTLGIGGNLFRNHHRIRTPFGSLPNDWRWINFKRIEVVIITLNYSYSPGRLIDLISKHFASYSNPFEKIPPPSKISFPIRNNRILMAQRFLLYFAFAHFSALLLFYEKFWLIPSTWRTPHNDNQSLWRGPISAFIFLIFIDGNQAIMFSLWNSWGL